MIENLLDGILLPFGVVGSIRLLFEPRDRREFELCETGVAREIGMDS